MMEAAIFVVTVGIALVSLLYAFGLGARSADIAFVVLVLLLIPGLYGAFASAPFVPSTRKRQEGMLRLAELKPTDVAYDLGCGDGRLVLAAAKIAKKAVGIELSVPLVLFGKIKAFLARSKAQIRLGNMWSQSYKEADVIFCYLLPKAVARFHRDIWPTLRPGTRVVCNGFPVHSLTPERVEEKVYLYRKPAEKEALSIPQKKRKKKPRLEKASGLK